MSDKIYNKADIGVVKKLSDIKEYDLEHYYHTDIKGVVYKNVKNGYVKMKPFITKKGYVEYVLTTRTGTKKHVQAQRLVCILHHKNPKNLPHVNHKDGNKQNNHKDNLEWTSISDNNKHKFRVLGHVIHNKGKKKNG